MDERTLNKKLKFIESYKAAVNAASGSEVDSKILKGKEIFAWINEVK